MSKLTLGIGTVPGTPDTGQVSLYPKSDKLLYHKNSDGVERLVTARIPAITTTLCVDVRRTDSYTPDGSLELPFKTVMSAVNQIIANGDNSTAKVYAVRIMGPCEIVENIVLESAALTDLYIYADAPYGSVSISPASGLALRSTANNEELHLLIIENLLFTAGVTLAGGSDASHFMSANCMFIDCDFDDTVSVSNGEGMTFQGGGMNADLVIQNIFALFMIAGFGFNANISVTYNSGAPKPSGLTACNVILDACVATGDITLGDNTTLQARGGARVGSSGGTLAIGNGTATLYASFVRSNITIGAGGTLVQRGGMVNDALLTNLGTRVKDVTLANFKSFKSTEQTGTGIAQSIAHGLGYIPGVVIAAPSDDTANVVGGFSIVEGAHDATNVVITASAGLKYKVVAF